MAAITSESQGESKGLDAPDPWVIDVTKITLDQEIGQGSFGTVYLGEYQLNPVAIKKISSAANKEQQEATRVRHPNVIQLIGVCVAPPMLVIAYAAKNTLRHVLDNDDLSLTSRLDIIKGVSRGMYALHDEDILHLDLKPTNVVLNQDMVPWITDFGLSFAMSASMSTGSTKSGRGTMRYKAPESWRPKSKGGPLTHKPTDMFSFAMLMWETFTGAVPFADTADTAVIDMHKEVYYGESKEGDSDLRPSLDLVPENIRTILSACWEHDFVKRPSFERVCERLNRIGGLHQDVPAPHPNPPPDVRARSIVPPYLLCYGHSSLSGAQGPVFEMTDGQALVTYTQPGHLGWTDEADAIMGHIEKENELLATYVSTAVHKYCDICRLNDPSCKEQCSKTGELCGGKGIIVPAAKVECRPSHDVTPNYTFEWRDKSVGGKDTMNGYWRDMGVFVRNAQTSKLERVKESDLRLAGIDTSTIDPNKAYNSDEHVSHLSGKISVRKLFALANHLNIKHVVGLGCKRGEVQNEPPWILVPNNKKGSIKEMMKEAKEKHASGIILQSGATYDEEGEYIMVDGSIAVKTDGSGSCHVIGGFAVLPGQEGRIELDKITTTLPQAVVS